MRGLRRAGRRSPASVYSGLVPMSPYTIPSAPRPSTGRLAWATTSRSSLAPPGWRRTGPWLARGAGRDRPVAELVGGLVEVVAHPVTARRRPRAGRRRSRACGRPRAAAVCAWGSWLSAGRVPAAMRSWSEAVTRCVLHDRPQTGAASVVSPASALLVALRPQTGSRRRGRCGCSASTAAGPPELAAQVGDVGAQHLGVVARSPGPRRRSAGRGGSSAARGCGPAARSRPNSVGVRLDLAAGDA